MLMIFSSETVRARKRSIFYRNSFEQRPMDFATVKNLYNNSRETSMKFNQ